MIVTSYWEVLKYVVNNCDEVSVYILCSLKFNLVKPAGTWACWDGPAHEHSMAEHVCMHAAVLA